MKKGLTFAIDLSDKSQDNKKEILTEINKGLLDLLSGRRCTIQGNLLIFDFIKAMHIDCNNILVAGKSYNTYVGPDVYIFESNSDFLNQEDTDKLKEILQSAVGKQVYIIPTDLYWRGARLNS